jgi:hypothetical protein
LGAVLARARLQDGVPAEEGPVGERRLLDGEDGRAEDPAGRLQLAQGLLDLGRLGGDQVGTLDDRARTWLGLDPRDEVCGSIRIAAAAG